MIKYLKRKVHGFLKKRGYRLGTKQGQDSEWSGMSSSSRSGIQTGHSTMLARARDLAANNYLGIQGMRKFASNLVGNGIIPNSYSKQDGDIVDAEWEAWETDADFYEFENIQSLFRIACNAVFVSGSVFIVRRRTNRRSKIQLSIQILEPEYLYNLLDSYIVENRKGFIEKGIQYDEYGRVDGYWLYKEHPGNLTRRVDLTPVYVPKSDCLLVSWSERPETVLAPSWLNPVGNVINDIEEYEHADLVKKKISSCFSGFVRDLDVPGDAEEDEDLETIIPGRIEKLPPGKTIEFPNPPQDNNTDYTRSRKKDVAAGLGLTYEGLTSDYRDVNFSSARIARDEQNIFFDQLQRQLLIPKICEPVRAWFVEELFLSGLISTPFVKTTWTTPARPFIQPNQEVDAIVKKLEYGLVTPSEVLRSLGKDPERHWSELQEDIKWMESHEISVSKLPVKGGEVGTTELSNNPNQKI